LAVSDRVRFRGRIDGVAARISCTDMSGVTGGAGVGFLAVSAGGLAARFFFMSKS
jgi:hypothetical protein